MRPRSDMVQLTRQLAQHTRSTALRHTEIIAQGTLKINKQKRELLYSEQCGVQHNEGSGT